VRLWDSQAGTLVATLAEGECHFTIFPDASTLYLGITKHAPSVSGLVRVKLTGPPLSLITTPVCWFPSNWQIASGAFDSIFSSFGIGCKNGRVYILDISQALKGL
jgi:hypothetical protein